MGESSHDWGFLALCGPGWDISPSVHWSPRCPVFPRVLFVLADQPTLTPNVDLATIVVSMKFFTDAIKSGLYAVG